MMNRTGWSRGLRAALIAMIALLLVWAAVALNNSTNASDGDSVTETPSADPVTPTSTVSPTDSVKCPAGFAQKDISDPSLNRFIEGGIDAKTAAKSRHKLLAAVRHDASSMKFYAQTFGIKNLPSEAEMLTVDEACLSEVGQQVYHDLRVVMNASGVKFGQAPSGAYNSGVNKDGLPVIDTAPGVRGNKKAIIVTLPDGSQAIILVRCGNPVFLTPPPGVPTGQTDNPPPTSHPTPTPTPTCVEIPGNGVMECQPKDPGQDPAPSGNAPQGGGPNNNPGPGSPNPQPTFPSSPHTNPPAPEPSQTPPSSPPPPPATGAPDPTEAPSTCVPPPGKTTC